MENFIYNDELPHYNKRVENRMKGLSEGFETRLRKKNGTLVWASAMSTPIVDPDKGFQGSFAMVTDITDRKIAELALKESEERLRKLLNSVTDYIYTVKVEKGKVVDTIHGEGCKTVTGYSTQEFKNDNYLWYKIIHDSDKKTVKDHAESLISNNEEQNIEHRIIHKNGTIRWVRNTPVLRRNPEGTIIGYDGLISDITKEKQLESQILNSVIETEERERMHFSQELHDGIGPLLSATKMYVQWLAMPNANLNHHEILKDIEKLLDESTSTVREISFKLSPHILQNYGFVEAMGAYIEKVKESSNIKIKMNLRNLCRFDEKAETIVYRVLCECINNTLKHAKASEIAMNMSCIDNALIVDYSDNGKGFDVNAVMAGHKGIGLLNMQSRLKSINGVMEIISKPHEGTSIKFQIGIYNN